MPQGRVGRGAPPIGFETLFALLYAFTLRGALPDATTFGGIALLCCKGLLGVRCFRRQGA